MSSSSTNSYQHLVYQKFLVFSPRSWCLFHLSLSLFCFKEIGALLCHRILILYLKMAYMHSSFYLFFPFSFLLFIYFLSPVFIFPLSLLLQAQWWLRTQPLELGVWSLSRLPRIRFQLWCILRPWTYPYTSVCLSIFFCQMGILFQCRE